VNNPELIPKLRHHQVQRNYVAIWYSVVIHFFVIIFLVNYSNIDIRNIFTRAKENLIEIIEYYKPDSIEDLEINEVFTERKIITS